ncbi:hypothetical protein DFP72DRAFT_1069124 [Ephemerocybe angulata]|uniref:Uncharacterized protein n=1 Tax=Ephemerocybe angulata TaxID=980116 RepID=A0A8H6HVD2_9AGAR|nr:hypothetical protein DFP72DRAFT_1069124 [Tulosesus angulatus]
MRYTTASQVDINSVVARFCTRPPLTGRNYVATLSFQVTNTPYFAIPRSRYTVRPASPSPPVSLTGFISIVTSSSRASQNRTWHSSSSIDTRLTSYTVTQNLMSHSLLKPPDSVSDGLPGRSQGRNLLRHTKDNAPPYVDHLFAHRSLAHQIHFYTYFVILDPVSKAHVALPGFNSRHILSRRSGRKLHRHTGSMHGCQIHPFARVAALRSP